MSLAITGLRSGERGPYDLAVESGRCATLEGPSGIGKSLLLRMIADLDPSTGTVALDGVPREQVKATEWRRRVLYVPADAGWWADTVAANLRDPAAVRALCPALGLAPSILEAAVAQLSTGERQRLALLRALTLAPRFLLLDEPTASLDPKAKALVEALLLERKAAGLGLLVVTHDAEQARRLGDEHWTLTADGLVRA